MSIESKQKKTKGASAEETSPFTEFIRDYPSVVNIGLVALQLLVANPLLSSAPEKQQPTISPTNIEYVANTSNVPEDRDLEHNLGLAITGFNIVGGTLVLRQSVRNYKKKYGKPKQ